MLQRGLCSHPVVRAGHGPRLRRRGHPELLGLGRGFLFPHDPERQQPGWQRRVQHDQLWRRHFCTARCSPERPGGPFLGPDSATGQATPAQLDFGAGLGFTSLSPGIGQIFFIGDGLTSDSNAGDFSGQVQQFVVPVGATRLYLGRVDGFGWYNNVGSFDVTVTNVSAIPEPGTYGLMLAGLAVVGWGVRRFRSARA